MLADRWGVTDTEIARRYPCDDVVPAPAVAAWRGVTVAAPPAAVWPWVAQIRFAPYSYDWIDNLGRRSPRELLDVAPPRPGDPFSSSGGRPLGRILSVEAGRHVTGRIAGSVISYVLEAEPAGRIGMGRRHLDEAGAGRREGEGPVRRRCRERRCRAQHQQDARNGEPEQG